MSHPHIMFYICLPITLLCIFGFCRKEGLWSLLIKCFCLFFATAFALCWFEPLANQFDRIPKWAYYNDMWAYLVLFSVVLFLEILVTNRLSRVNLQFPAKANRLTAFALLAVIFVGFYFVTAQTFYYLLPERPDYQGEGAKLDQIQKPFQYQLTEYLSSHSLAPLQGGNDFIYSDFFVRQFKRRSAVYHAVCSQAASSSSSSGKSPWQFSGDKSPNLTSSP